MINNLVGRLLSQALFGRISRYKSVMKWLWLEAYGSYKALSLASGICMFVALALKLGSLALLAKYLHVLERNTVLVVLGYDFGPARTSFSLLVTATSVSLGMFALSSVVQYLSEVYSMRLCIRFEERCVSRALSVIARLGSHPRMARLQPDFVRIVSIDARFCGTTARLILRSLLPGITAVTMLAALLYLNAGLTASLIILVLMLVPFLYKSSLKGARHSKQLEEQTPKANIQKRQIVEELAEKWRQSDSGEFKVEQEFQQGPLRLGLDAYFGRLVASAESTFLASLLMAVAIFTLLLQEGTHLLQLNSSWGQFTTYLLVLRMCLNNFTQISGLAAGINRIYPQVSRFMKFDLLARDLVAAGQVSPATKDIWQSGAGRSAGGATQTDDLLDDGI